jgi:hypothetical protein
MFTVNCDVISVVGAQILTTVKVGFLLFVKVQVTSSPAASVTDPLWNGVDVVTLNAVVVPVVTHASPVV